MASSVTRETFINAVRDALGFDRGGIDAFLKAINPATSAEDTAKASRPAATGSADGDARDKAGGGSLDQPYVPKVGDVVRYVTDINDDHDRLVVAIDGLGQMTLRSIKWPGNLSFGTNVAELWRFIRVGTATDRAIAGLDQPAPVAPAPSPEPAATPAARRPYVYSHLKVDGAPPVDESATKPVDREGLIDFMRAEVEKWVNNTDDRRPCVEAYADAAIAYFAKLGGAK